jgi:hypothetical protein
MDIPSQFAEWNLLALVQLSILPAIAGTTSYFVLLRSKMGRLRIQRALTQDESNGRPIWRIVATSLGKSVSDCTIRVDGRSLRWDGVGSIDLNIGSDGIAMANIPFEVDRGSSVVVKSGPFLIFRGRFGLVEEVCMSKRAYE